MIKKGIALFTAFLLMIFGLSMCSINTITSGRVDNPAGEQPISFELTGEVSEDDLTQHGIVQEANASDSWIELRGGISTGKVTAASRDGKIQVKKGDLGLYTVGEDPTQYNASGGTTAGGAQGAIQWARMIASDDSFTYGSGGTAHKSGCYFCGTNIRKKGKKYEKTYCCNPFIFSAYAHGANDQKMLEMCKKGRNGSTGANASSWERYGFKDLGKPDWSEIQAGDVFLHSGYPEHVWMVTDPAQDLYIEATSHGGGEKSWSADSIYEHKGAKKSLNSANNVVRYMGNGAGGTSLISAGGSITGATGSGVSGALAWAKQVADDNSYTYRCVNWCSLCHSNRPKVYCCAGFVRSAYAHGAGDTSMMKACKSESAATVSGLRDAMKNSGNFVSLGSISKDKLIPGDVIFHNGYQHVEMYWGDGKEIGAHGIQNHTPADSISIRNVYGSITEVLRYKGAGGGLTAPTYDKKHIIEKLGTSQLTEVVSSGTGTLPTSQSMEYMGNGKIAICETNTRGGGSPSKARIAIYENGSNTSNSSIMNLGYGNGLAYDGENFLVATKKSGAKGASFIGEKSLSKSSAKNMPVRTFGIGYDKNTSSYAISDGGKISIFDSTLENKKGQIRKKVVENHTQDLGFSSGVVYECTQNNKTTNGHINMYNATSGAYFGSYELDFNGEIESCDVDEEGHLLILVHKKGTNVNTVFRTKEKKAILDSSNLASIGQEGTQGLTVREDVRVNFRFKKEESRPTNTSIPTSLLSIVKAAEWTPTEENLQIANQVASALVQRGYTRESIAGVLGNIQAEGGMRTSAIESNGEGIGLCQWSFGRKTNLKKYAHSFGKEWTDLEVQISFLCHELDNPQYESMEEQLKSCMDVTEATKIFMDEFERPGIPHFDNRVKYARGYFETVSATGASVGLEHQCNLSIHIDLTINKCVVNGTIGERRVEGMGDIQFDGNKIVLSAKSLAASQFNGQYVTGQLAGMRTEYPEAGNKWYFDRSINPFPRNSHGGNCTWYAYGRFCEIAGEKIPMSSYGNAVTFYDSFPSCQKGKTPALGAIICWGYGSEHGNPGHVAVVEEIKANGDIVCSNSGWSGSKFWMSTHKKENGYTMGYRNDVFRGFIYNPKIGTSSAAGTVGIGNFSGKSTNGKIMIAEAAMGETGSKTGNKPGDQTGDEVRVRKLHGNWAHMFRPKDPNIGLAAAKNMYDAAKNEKVGYEAGDKSFFKAMENAGGDASAIQEGCGVACSQMVAICYYYAGYETKWYVDAAGLTETYLESSYFEHHDDYSESELRPGDVLVTPGRHALMVIQTPN